MMKMTDRILVAGYTGDYPYNFALARYTSDGALDPSFGENGKIITDFGSDYEQANSIAVQQDKILVAGTIDYVNFDFALVRYTNNGF